MISKTAKLANMSKYNKLLYEEERVGRYYKGEKKYRKGKLHTDKKQTLSDKRANR